MNVGPCKWKTIDDEHWTLRVEDFAFGGSLESIEDELSPFSIWKLPFGGLGHHFLSLDITLEG
jgi:hypothetical protein